MHWNSGQKWKCAERVENYCKGQQSCSKGEQNDSTRKQKDSVRKRRKIEEE